MSRVVLDRAVQARGYRVAALVAGEVEGHRLGEALVFWGGKAAVGFLIAGPAGMQAFDAQGKVLNEAAVEALAPGAWAAFAQGGSRDDFPPGGG